MNGWALAHGSVSTVLCHVGQCTHHGGAPVRTFGSSPLQMASTIVPAVIDLLNGACWCVLSASSTAWISRPFRERGRHCIVRHASRSQ
eukprot:2070298-Pyramimonas_sp.AAC.1